MKKYKLIALIFWLFIFTSCSDERGIKILGYGYKGEKIVVLENKKVIFNKLIDGNLDNNKLCSFYETQLRIKKIDVKLNFKIDSSGVVVLDTFLIIPNKSKIPFVSFIYPYSNSKFKRELFLGDENDSLYIKY